MPSPIDPPPGCRVPPALPLRDRAVPRRRSRPDDRRRQTASDRLPPSARSTHRACCAVVSSERAIIEVEGLRKAFGETIALAGVDLDVPGGHGARAARPERRGQDDARPHPRDAADARRRHRAESTGTTSSASAAEGAAADRPRRPVRRGRRHAHRPREPRDGRPAVRPAPERGAKSARPRRWSVSALTDAADRLVTHLLRRHAAASRPRREPGRRAPRAAAGRADHRPRPAYAASTCGISSASSCADGATLLLTTQYLEEADRLADRIVGDRPRRGDRARHVRRAEGARSAAM